MNAVPISIARAAAALRATWLPRVCAAALILAAFGLAQPARADDVQQSWVRTYPGTHYGDIESAVRLVLPSPALPGSGAGGRRPTAALSARSSPGSRRDRC